MRLNVFVHHQLEVGADASLPLATSCGRSISVCGLLLRVKFLEVFRRRGRARHVLREGLILDGGHDFVGCAREL